MRYLLVGLLTLDAGLHLFACASRDRLMLRRITKCLLMPLLAACYMLFSASPRASVLAAILFGFTGDVVLLFRPRRFAFPAGILAFATGHVFYIISFAKRFAAAPPWFLFAVFGVISLLCASLLTSYLWKGLPKKLRPPSFAYMLIIGTMVSFSALFTLYAASAHRWYAIVGGILFAISDTTLSIDAFHRPVRYRNVIVMSTYIAAQTLIVSALAFS